MVGKPASKPERDRMGTIKNNIPCLPCLLLNHNRLPSVQHVVSGFRREGHSQTYPSCNWHHFGYTEGKLKQEVSGMLGPSLAHGKRTFQQYFGLESNLVEVTSYLLQQFAIYPWIDYDIPHDVLQNAQKLWMRKK